MEGSPSLPRSVTFMLMVVIHLGIVAGQGMERPHYYLTVQSYSRNYALLSPSLALHLGSNISAEGPVRKNVTCTFEPAAPTCDWQLLPEPHLGYNTSVVAASTGARLGGPSTDVNRGTAEGKYH